MKASELNLKIKQGQSFNIFDVRQKERYDDFHLQGALHLEKGLLLESPNKYMNKQDTYYVTCNGGNSAGMIAAILSNQGFKIISLEGGMNELLKKD